MVFHRSSRFSSFCFILSFCFSEWISLLCDLLVGWFFLLLTQICYWAPIVNVWEKLLAPHSSTLAWTIPWTEEPGGLQSMGSLRFGHNWPTSLSLFTFMHWRRKRQSTPVFLPGKSQGQGSLVLPSMGSAQSWTQLQRLSSSSSECISVFILFNSRISLFLKKTNFCLFVYILYLVWDTVIIL